MDQFINILLIIHASLGGVSLIAGSISMITKKGNKNHKLSGKLFSICLMIASILAIPVTLSPGHKSQFLFLIAIFTIYLILTGNRALRNKHKSVSPNIVDYSISGIMALFAVGLIVFGVIGLLNDKGGRSILYLFFGILAFVNTIGDYKYYKIGVVKKGAWVKQHIRKIMGAYIASTTAFLVTAINGRLIVWIAPTVVGTIFIIYWIRKTKKQYKA